MIPPFIYVSRCGLRRTAYCSGREETRCAEICQQRVELLDDVLYACRIGNSCRRARIARSSRTRRTCWAGRTRCAGRTDCAYCTRNTLWADGACRSGCANRAGGSGYALNALRSLRACGACGTRLTLRSGRPNGARRTGDALKTLYTLRPRRPDRADGAAGCTGSSRRPRCAGRHWAYRTSRSDGCHRRRRPAGTAGHSRRSRSRRRGWRNRTDRPHRPTGYCGCSRRSRSYRRNGSYRPNRSYGSDWTERYARGGSCCRCDKRRGRRRAVQRAAGKSPRSGSPLDLSNKRCGASRTAIHI